MLSQAEPNWAKLSICDDFGSLWTIFQSFAFNKLLHTYFYDSRQDQESDFWKVEIALKIKYWLEFSMLCMYLSILPFFKRQFKVSKRIQVNVKNLDISIIRTTRYTHPIHDKTFDKCSTSCSTIFYEKREEVFL